MTPEEGQACFEWVRGLMAEELGPSIDSNNHEVRYPTGLFESVIRKHIPIDVADRLFAYDSSGRRKWADVSDHDTGILMKAGADRHLPLVEDPA